jgi:lantibiotic biosynthesis protein
MQFKFLNQFIYRTPINHTQNKFISDEMIYLASPILLEEYKKNENDEKVKLSLKKYSQRASSRCTPFGMFAGCGVGEWHETNNAVLSDTSFNRQTRLDMNVTCEIAQLLSQHKVIKKHLLYFPNNSYYEIADKVRYVEYTLVNKMRSYQITAVEQSEYLSEIFEKAKDGISYLNIIQLLLKYEVDEEEATAFIDELIQSQVLLSNLYPNVTGNEFFKIIVKTLKDIQTKINHEDIDKYIQLLEKIEKDILTIDQNKSNAIESYKAVYLDVKQILPNVTEENLFQTDLYYDYKVASLQATNQLKLMDTMQFLNKLYPTNNNSTLSKFRENFSKRYESQEKPLLEVLDTECGIGFKSKDNTGINILADDIYATGKSSGEYELKWNATYSFLFKKLMGAIKNNKTSVTFTDEDIKDFKENKNSFPPSMAVFFSVLDKEKNNLYFKHAAGSSASNLLGRFAHGNKAIHDIIKNTTAHEKLFYDDKIIAEIIHLPESRIGNVLLRPHIHEYEIAYLSNSTKDKDFVIDLNDLYVSVAGDKVVLKSKKLNKEIIPRLTTAHNYSMSTLPVYQFLCELQSQYYSVPALSFNWGPLANEFEFLPRAEYKDIIISPASWHVSKKKFEKLIENLKTFNPSQIETWQAELNLPALFLLSDGDNELLVDLKDELSVKAFIGAIKKRDNITLTEFLHDGNNSFVSDHNKNSFTNELIAILHNEEVPEKNKDSESAPEEKKSLVQRNFITGSEWLYYKIYSSTKSSETILVNAIYPMIQNLLANNILDKWFFIRYADPETHLRLRFKVKDPNQLTLITNELNAILSPLIENSLVEKVVNDTYNREIERYGATSMDLSETLFGIDSLDILKLINEINDDEQGDLIKMKYACYHTCLLIQHFGFEGNDILQIIDRGQLSYFNEHGGNKDLKLQLDNKYRKYRKEIDAFLMNPELRDSEENAFIFDLSQVHFELAKPLLIELRSTIETNKEINLPDYIFSLVHMHVNRLFKSKQRTYELIMYDFLQRSIKSINARKSKNKVMTPEA